MSVTANLESALRALACDDAFGGCYKLWIDAICINQVDDQEKAQQVMKMREIYSGAWAVIAWIETSFASADINHAFQFLRILASLQGDQRDLGNWQTGSGEPSKGTYFCAVNDLMRQKYWFRLWVIQELIMGLLPRSSAMGIKSSTGVRFAKESVSYTMDPTGYLKTESESESLLPGASATVHLGRHNGSLRIRTTKALCYRCPGIYCSHEHLGATTPRKPLESSRSTFVGG